VSLTCRLPPGFVLHTFDTVGSTNDEARRLAEAEACEGQVVFAKQQTRGRGRYGRRWQSPPGNLYASVLLRPVCPPGEAARLSLLAGLALAEAIERFAPHGMDLALKWPNDVILRGAKTAGVLLESATGADGNSTWVIVGTGVNIVHHPQDVPYPATLIVTADHDDRVVPAHSFKYAATLQARHVGENPTLIRIGTKSGHGARSLTKGIEETADTYAFIFHHLGVEPQFAV